MKITRHEEFEMAHILDGYDGGCGNLHGHSYRIEVTVEGPQDPNYFDMVMDFNFLKEAIKKNIPDHKFAVNNTKTEGYEYEIWKVNQKYGKATEEFPFVTTAENMVGYIAEKIDKYIKDVLGFVNVDVVRVDLWETTNSHATWVKGAMN